MTSMRVVWIAVLMLGGCASNAGADPSTGNVALTKDRVFKYAFEAYPQWSASHPDKECPAKLAELDDFMAGSMARNPAGKDFWGHPLHMFCGANLPAGAKGFAVSSDGPDGKPNTPDDIRSW